MTQKYNKVCLLGGLEHNVLIDRFRYGEKASENDVKTKTILTFTKVRCVHNNDDMIFVRALVKRELKLMT